MSSNDGDGRYYTSAGDIHGVFRALQAERCNINLQFGNRGAFFNTMILETRLRQRLVLLDEITPRKGHDQAGAGTPFSLRASLQGIRVYVPELRITRVLSNDDGMYYEAPFPERLLYLQRRDAFRAPVPAHLEVRARCHFRERESVSAHVRNMSATGLRLAVPGKMDPPLDMVERFSLELELPGSDTPVFCQAEAIHSWYDRQQDHTLCGCRFVDLSRAETVAINRFVTRLQRESVTQGL